MIQAAICSKCNTLKWVDYNQPFHNLTKCDNCGSPRMEMIDEEALPIILTFGSKGIKTDFSCGGHVTYHPEKMKMCRVDKGYISFRACVNGYHFKLKEFDNDASEESNKLYNEFTSLFSAINGQEHYAFSMECNGVLLRIHDVVKRVRYEGSEDMIRSSLDILVSKFSQNMNAYDIKGAICQVWKYLLAFIETYLDVDDETIYTNIPKYSEIEDIEIIVPVLPKPNLPKNDEF